MGKFCMNCGKIMKNSELSHCSDECLLSDIKNSEPVKKNTKGAELWNEKSDAWK